MDPDKTPGNKEAHLSYKDLEPSLRRRIRITCLIAAVWAGVIFSSAGVFVALMPWMDAKREERRKIAEENSLKEQEFRAEHHESTITQKIEELKINTSTAS